MIELVTQFVPALSALGGAFLGMVGVLWSNASKNKHERLMEESRAQRELKQKRVDETFAIYSEFAGAAMRVLDAQRAIVAASIYRRDSYDELLPQLSAEVTSNVIILTEAQAKILLRGSKTAKHKAADVVELLQTMTPYRGGAPMDLANTGKAADTSTEVANRIGVFLTECSKEFQDLPLT